MRNAPRSTKNQRTCERKTEFPLDVAKWKISLAKTLVDAISAMTICLERNVRSRWKNS